MGKNQFWLPGLITGLKRKSRLNNKRPSKATTWSLKKLFEWELPKRLELAKNGRVGADPLNGSTDAIVGQIERQKFHFRFPRVPVFRNLCRSEKIGRPHLSSLGWFIARNVLNATITVDTTLPP